MVNAPALIGSTDTDLETDSEGSDSDGQRRNRRKDKIIDRNRRTKDFPRLREKINIGNDLSPPGFQRARTAPQRLVACC